MIEYYAVMRKEPIRCIPVDLEGISISTSIWKKINTVRYNEKLFHCCKTSDRDVKPLPYVILCGINMSLQNREGSVCKKLLTQVNWGVADIRREEEREMLESSEKKKTELLPFSQNSIPFTGKYGKC